MTKTALVVDDEVDLCRLMQITLTKMGIKSDVAYTLSQAKSYWQDNHYDFCLTDLKLPDGSGLELVKQISNSSSTPVAVITAYGNMDLAIEALKLGAFDFVNKPLELPRLRQLVENALKVIHQDYSTEVPTEGSPEQQMLDSRLIGDSAVMQTLKHTILKLARSQAPVFLSGASGTGKEVVARLIHDLSPRRDGNFVPVNCGAIPTELMESEFFGHKKGSFTGAFADKQGLFQQANGGTLFLDEVADLPLAMQVKLLRAIQEKTVRAIGDTKEVPVDTRILSATHKDLNQLVQEGTFRQDLYYRINVIELKLPTLNARREDIPVLAQHFLALITEEWQLGTPPSLTADACLRLQNHGFAGNVRELRNVLERAVTLAETSTIDISHLGLPELSIDYETTRHGEKTIADNHTAAISKVQSSAAGPAKPSEHLTDSFEQRPAASAIVRTEDNPQVVGSSDSELSFDGELPLKGLAAYLQDQEKHLIITALKQTDWNKTQAAELLGTTFRSLRYRMKKLDIAEDQHGK
ncbi:two-component system response regulator PilR (NtrC family) [Psychrobacter sp. PL19]|uniref:sigma-54-dependent transcriptional regulator n=1 Tax=Psychrobacter sp. PL19 TaxID=2760711 RepID=UPI001AE7735D